MKCKYCANETPRINRSSKYFCSTKCNILHNVLFDESGCWIYQKGPRKDGYCNFGVNGKTDLVHRAMYEVENGEIKDRNKIVCHVCDNRKCCNPDHLYLGSHSSNALDRQQRNPRSDQTGENNHASKLSENEVLEIRKEYKKTNAYEISNKYGISPSYVKDVALGRRWKHLGVRG